MRFRPLGDESKRKGGKPVGLVTAGAGELTVWTQWGAEVGRGDARDVLARYSDHVLYALSSFQGIRSVTGPEGWTLFQWARRAIVWQQLGDTRILPSRGVFQGLHPAEAMGELLAIARDAGAHRVRMGSWSSMSRQLWRSTLEQPVALAGRQLDRAGLYGGRKDAAQWCRGAMLENVAHVDLKGAYPAAMWREPYPTRMVRAKRPHIDGESIVRAIVSMPPQPWPVVPERIRSDVIRWKSGRMVEGWWSARELRTARESGADVRPLETWEGTRQLDVFHDWGTIVHVLRERPGVQARWWKGVSNALWGTFSMAPEGGRLITLAADGLPDKVEPVRGGKPIPATASYVASLTAARVRDQVCVEALGSGWNSGAVHVDTDGVMILANHRLPDGATDHPVPGQWKVDRIMPRVMIRGPQAWAWWDEDDQPHVSISGITGATLDHLHRVPLGASLVVGAKRRTDAA